MIIIVDQLSSKPPIIPEKHFFTLYRRITEETISEYEKVSSVSKQFVKVAAPSITRLDIYAVQDDYNPFLYHFKPIAESSWGTLAYEWSFGD